MVWVAVDYLVSKASHLNENEMFRGIDCVMIPKMPLIAATKEFLMETYGPFLQENYKTTLDLDLWTVMSARAARFGLHN